MNEILPSGQVVHLDNLKPSKAKTEISAQRHPQGIPEQKSVPQQLKENDPSQVDGPIATEPKEPREVGQEKSESKIAPRVLAETTPVKRQKHKVWIRQTDEGIEEITDDQRREGQEHGSGAGFNPEAGKKDIQPSTTANSDGDKDQSPTKYAPAPSTAQSWVAFAVQTDAASRVVQLPKAEEASKIVHDHHQEAEEDSTSTDVHQEETKRASSSVVAHQEEAKEVPNTVELPRQKIEASKGFKVGRSRVPSIYAYSGVAHQ